MFASWFKAHFLNSLRFKASLKIVIFDKNMIKILFIYLN